MKYTQNPKDAKEVVLSAAFNDFDEFLMSYSTDIQGGGLFIEADKLLPLGSKVRLYFTLASSRIPILEGYGEVVSIQREDQENVGGMAIKFFDLSEKSRQLLSRLVKNFL